MNTIKRQLEPVPFTAVTFEDNFWAPRLEINQSVTIPAIYQQLEQTGRITSFDLNFQRDVPSHVTKIFSDSDTAKWLEAASFALASQHDPALEVQVNSLVDKIIRAQQPDGYINTHFIVAQPDMRWRNLRDWHELYCAGHLIEAAVANYQATGGRKLLDALSRYADCIDATFGPEPGKKRGYCGHPEVELSLIKLYNATHNERYLNLASFFVEERGRQPYYYDIEARERGEDPADFWARTYEYCQAQVPIRQQEKVVGHAVRAMYLLSGVSDLASEKNDPTLLETCERLWHNLITRRMYITGAIGPSRHNEGFTLDYDLPDETAYGETCATIGLILWNHRLLQFSGESKYADVMERGLYNGFLSGVSLDGERFFYENPLASAGGHHRQTWFDCPCCPPNLARLMASLGGYFYSTGPQDVWVHLYAQNRVSMDVSGTQIKLRQETKYPWEGAVKFLINPSVPMTFTLHLRLPGWCDQWSLKVNGQPVLGLKPGANGYLAIIRQWQADDTVEFVMGMPVRAMRAHPAVRFLQRRMALQRGPLLYCLEGIDHGNVILDKISIDPDHLPRGESGVEYRDDLLGGVSLIHGMGEIVDEEGWGDTLYMNRPPASRKTDLTAIPYYAWDNRVAGEMRVWVAER